MIFLLYPIIAGSNPSIHPNNKSQKPKELWTKNEAGELIRVIETNDAEQEANFVADKIQKLINLK